MPVPVDALAGAPCQGTPLHWWHPARGVPPVHAAAVCRTCPLTAACADYMDAVEAGQPPSWVHGYAAGMTPAERVARRAAR